MNACAHRSWLLAFVLVMVQVSLCWGWGGAPQKKPAEVPEAPQPTATGVGRYEIAGVDYYLRDAGIFTDFQESNQPLKGDSARDSVIVIRGIIQGKGIVDSGDTGQAASLHPFFDEEVLLLGLPPSCRAEVVTYPQLNRKQQRYVAYVSFKETASRPECWEYFRTLTTLKLQLKEIKTGTRANLPPLPVLNGGRRVLELGPLLPKGGKK